VPDSSINDEAAAAAKVLFLWKEQDFVDMLFLLPSKAWHW